MTPYTRMKAPSASRFGSQYAAKYGQSRRQHANLWRMTNQR